MSKERKKLGWEYKTLRKESNVMEPLLNELGQDDWELVSVCNTGQVMVALLKRRVLAQ